MKSNTTNSDLGEYWVIEGRRHEINSRECAISDILDFVKSITSVLCIIS